MHSNFILFESYAVHFEGKHLDLHNNFDFIGFSYSSETKLLKLNWVGTKADWVPKDNPSNLSISISDVEYLKIIPRDKDVPFSEDSCLSHFTYCSSRERNDDDCVVHQEYPTDDDDIIFKFQSEHVIRAKGSSVIVEISANQLH